MIYGIGCDNCAIARMEKILQKPNAAHFLQRVFAPSELDLFGINETKGGVQALSTFAVEKELPQLVTPKTVERLAANFAAKEAFLKATGMGFSGFALAEVAALRRESGAPYYAFCGSAADYMAQNNLTAHLSLSHEKGAVGMACAYCILETN